jgi:hypothetical protein
MHTPTTTQAGPPRIVVPGRSAQFANPPVGSLHAAAKRNDKPTADPARTEAIEATATRVANEHAAADASAPASSSLHHHPTPNVRLERAPPPPPNWRRQDKLSPTLLFPRTAAFLRLWPQGPPWIQTFPCHRHPPCPLHLISAFTSNAISQKDPSRFKGSKHLKSTSFTEA